MKMLASMKTRCPSGIWSSVEEAILFPKDLEQCLFPDKDGGPALFHDPFASLSSSGRLTEVALQSLFQELVKGSSLTDRFEPGLADQVLVKLGPDPLMHFWMMAACRGDVKDVSWVRPRRPREEDASEAAKSAPMLLVNEDGPVDAPRAG